MYNKFELVSEKSKYSPFAEDNVDDDSKSLSDNLFISADDPK